MTTNGQRFGELTKVLEAKAGRRVLLGGAALAAIGPDADAQTKRKRRKRKPKPPLAFASVFVNEMDFNATPDGFLAVEWDWDVAFIAPFPLDKAARVDNQVTIVPTGEDARRLIAAQARELVADRLDQFEVAPSRVAVTII